MGSRLFTLSERQTARGDTPALPFAYRFSPFAGRGAPDGRQARRRSRIILALCLLPVLFAGGRAAHAQGGGTQITQDTTWTKARSPYLISSTLEVEPGATLTIEPGVVVKLFGGASIWVKGRLVARGTPDQKIVFTSNNDPRYGGSASSSVSRGYWKEIKIFCEGSPAIGIFEHCLIRNGGDLSAYEGARLTVKDSRVENAGGIGVGLYGSDCLVEDSHVTGGGAQGILVVHNTSNFQVHTRHAAIRRCVFTNNAGPAIHAYTGVQGFDCQENTGSGNGVNGIVLQGLILRDLTLVPNPGFPYVVISNRFLETQTVVQPGVTLTLAPGVIMKFADGDDAGTLYVKGHLVARGTPGKRIVFTSIREDLDGDTNGDGSATTPGRGDWQGIRIGHPIRGGQPAVDGTAEMQHCDIRYGGKNSVANLHVVTTGSRLTASACNITDGGYAGVYGGGSALVRVKNSIITRNLFGARQVGTANLDARHNWWGHPSGPLDASDDRATGGDYNPTGQGDPVTDRVLYRNWLTEPGHGQTGGLNPTDGQGGASVNQIIAGDPITITVTDPDANESPTAPDTVPVSLVSDGGDQVTAILTETGPNTGVFTGTTDTAWGPPTQGDSILQVVGGNLITITYHDEQNSQGAPQDITHVVSVRSGNTASLSLSSSTIVAGEPITITIADKDLDETPGPGNDVLDLTLPTSGGDSVTLILEETQVAGIFTGTVPTEFALSPVTGDATLQVKGGDVITITYIDALDELGRPNQAHTRLVEVQTGTDGVLEIPAELTSSGGVPVAVVDPDANRDASAVETLSVVVTNETTGETETLTLVEAADVPGRFEGTLPTRFDETAGSSEDNLLLLKGGDVVRVTYTDAIGNDGRPNVVISKTAEVLKGSTGSATVVTTPILAGDPIPVVVTDADLAGRGTLSVTATSPLGDTETIALPETDQPGTFAGSVPTLWGETASSGDGKVQVEGGSRVIVTYIDAIDDVGRNNVPHAFEVPVRKGHDLELGTSTSRIIAGMKILVSVSDPDLDGQATVTVPVTTDGGDALSLTLGRTGSTPGHFEGEIETAFSLAVDPEDRVLQVKGGETILLTFEDTLDARGRRDVARGAVVTVNTGSDGSVVVPASFKSNEGLRITVIDPDADLNDEAPDTVTVLVSNPDRQDHLTVTLTETGNATGEFTGIAPTAFGETADPSDTILTVRGNDRIRALYVDAIAASGEPGVERTAWSVVQVGTTAIVDVEVPGPIQPGQSIRICITDPDQNLDPNQIDRITVTVRTSGGDQLVWVLEETASDTGVFCGNIPTEFSETPDPTDNILQVKGGDTITVTYNDPLDGDGRVGGDIVIVIEVKAGSTALLSVTAGTIHAGQPITITVTDADLIGQDPPTVHFTTTGGDQLTATLSVTGSPEEGRFSVTVPTQRSESVNPGDAILQVVGGQEITVTYIDAYDTIGRRDQGVSRTILVRNGADGTLWAPGSIQPGEPLLLTVTDPDLNGDPNVKETMTVTVLNPATGETEVVVLEETEAASGIFRKALPTLFGRGAGASGDGILRVAPGVTLRSSYEDITADGTLVTREATTTVTGSEVAHTFPAGRSLIGIPAQLFGPEVGDVLKIDGLARKLATYDPAQGYEIYTPGAANPLTGAFRPLVGYFASLNESAFNALREYGATLPQDQPHRIALKPGWNLIGSPFLSDAGWNRDVVRISIGGVEKTLRQAATEGSVVDYLWGLENGQYKLIADLDMHLPGSSRVMRAWNGYWILSAVNAELILPVPSATLASVRSVAKATEEGGWAFMLTAQRGASKDSAVVGTRGAAGVAGIQIQKAPALPGGDAVSLSIVADGPGAGPGLAYDVRTAAATGGGTSFRLRVDAGPSEEPVLLTWSDLRDVPARVRLLLVNEATGERRYLRTTSSVQVATTSGAPQFFRVVAEPAGDGLRVMGLGAAPGRTGGVAVTYSLSTSAQVEMTVLSLTGKPIRRLPQATVSTQGLNHATWDGRDASGRVVPAGTYLIELTARTDIGEVAKTSAPVVLR